MMPNLMTPPARPLSRLSGHALRRSVARLSGPLLASVIAGLPLSALAQETAPAAGMTTGEADVATPVDLKGPEAFADIEDEATRSAALFTEMGKVIESPRCLNCHPVTGGPLQGDAMHPHVPPMERGVADFGPDGLACTTCHGMENVEYASGAGSIPGNPEWALAPVEMGWVGLPLSEICAQIKDPERNGGKDLEALYEHNAENVLVGWGWEPGAGRTPAPGSQEIFGQLTRAWIDSGAACPS